MKKWEELDEEERREWRQFPVTECAIAMLRELEVFARSRLVAQAGDMNVGLEGIRFVAGELIGISHAIDQLTRVRK